MFILLSGEIVKKITNIILILLKNLLILWLPILLIEETSLIKFIHDEGIVIFSVIISIICLIIYIKNYKNNKANINCYLYNIINTILLIISNIALGYCFFSLIDLNIFHQCLGTGWSCFLFGIEYIIIGFIYAIISIIILIIWLLIKLIKYLTKK